MIMTVCRRTSASRQIFSRPLHSLWVAAEVTEAPSGWQDEAVLFSVPPEGLSILESHRTSQHSASLSDGCSPKSPEKQRTRGKTAEQSTATLLELLTPQPGAFREGTRVHLCTRTS